MSTNQGRRNKAKVAKQKVIKTPPHLPIAVNYRSDRLVHIQQNLPTAKLSTDCNPSLVVTCTRISPEKAPPPDFKVYHIKGFAVGTRPDSTDLENFGH